MSVLLPVAASAVTVGAAVGAFVAPLFGRKVAAKTADAAAREAAAAEWEVHTESLHKYAGGLADRLDKVEHRLDKAEERADKAELRADTAEKRANMAETLYRLAVEYVRHLAAWFSAKWPSETLPTPPPELEIDL
jgi:hypothetical protein